MIEQVEKIGVMSENKLFDLNILDQIIYQNQKEKRKRRDSTTNDLIKIFYYLQ